MNKKIAVHYINQFYAQIGGEEAAGQLPIVRTEPVGPGLAIQNEFGDELEIKATIICGDNYFADNQEKALKEILELIKKYNPDIFVAGPGFNAGRYGLACGTICDAVKRELNIPVVTALYPENPGTEMFKKNVHIIETGISAASMRKVIKPLVALAKKLVNDEEIGWPEEEGYIPQGYRINVQMEKTGAVRGVDMMIKKLKGEPFVTELPMPVFNKVAPAPAVKDIKKAKIALVTSGGIVPFGNPDRIESANASKYGIYDITGIDDLTGDKFTTVHGGYDPVYATEDPDRVLPLDVLRIMEKNHEIGELYNYYYATVGNTTAVSSAIKYAEEIAMDMKNNGIQAAILTSN